MSYGLRIKNAAEHTIVSSDTAQYIVAEVGITGVGTAIIDPGGDIENGSTVRSNAGGYSHAYEFIENFILDYPDHFPLDAMFIAPIDSDYQPLGGMSGKWFEINDFVSEPTGVDFQFEIDSNNYHGKYAIPEWRYWNNYVVLEYFNVSGISTITSHGGANFRYVALSEIEYLSKSLDQAGASFNYKKESHGLAIFSETGVIKYSAAIEVPQITYKVLLPKNVPSNATPQAADGYYTLNLPSTTKRRYLNITEMSKTHRDSTGSGEVFTFRAFRFVDNNTIQFRYAFLAAPSNPKTGRTDPGYIALNIMIMETDANG